MQEKQYIRQICMVSGASREELDSYNVTTYPVEQTTANILFERQAARSPS